MVDSLLVLLYGKAGGTILGLFKVEVEDEDSVVGIFGCEC